MLLLTTLMLPQQTVLIPLYGLLNDTSTLNTRAGLIAIHAAFGFPLQLLILAGFLSSMPRDIEDAAHIDGCGDVSMLRHVVIPLSLPAMAVGFLLNFVGIWKEFIFALTFLSAEQGTADHDGAAQVHQRAVLHLVRPPGGGRRARADPDADRVPRGQSLDDAGHLRRIREGLTMTSTDKELAWTR